MNLMYTDNALWVEALGHAGVAEQRQGAQDEDGRLRMHGGCEARQK